MQSILAEIERSKAELAEKGGVAEDDDKKEENEDKDKKEESDDVVKQKEREKERGRGKGRGREETSWEEFLTTSPRHERAISDDVQVLSFTFILERVSSLKNLT